MADIALDPAQPKAKRPYNKKASNPLIDAPSSVAQPGLKKVRVRKGAGSGLLHIDPDLIERLTVTYGAVFQWVISSSKGKEEYQERQNFTINGWEPVHSSMFGGAFDGMFYPMGFQGELDVGGQVLMHRPKYLNDEAIAEMQAAAREPIDLTERRSRAGIIDGTTSAVTTGTPKVMAYRKLETSIERPIPMPD
jgi:hypothetical protein